MRKQNKPRFVVFKRTLHGVRRGFFLMLVTLLVGLAYLHIVGFPAWTVAELENVLIKRGVFVKIGGPVKLDFLYGVEARNVTLYKTTYFTKPLVKIDSFSCGIHLKEYLFYGKRSVKSHLSGGRVYAEAIPQDYQSLIPAPRIDTASVFWRDGQFQLQQSNILVGKVRIYAAGDFFYDDDTFADQPAVGPSEFQERILGMVLQSVKLKDEAEVDIDFSVNGILPERSRMTASFDSGRLTICDQFFSGLDVEVALDSKNVTLRSLELANGAASARLYGSSTLQGFNTKLSLKNTLPLDYLARIFSTSIADQLIAQGVGFEDGFQLTVQSDGPGWMKHSSLSGTLFSQSLTARGLPFTNVFAAFNHADSALNITRLRGYAPTRTTNGRKIEGGELSASVRWDRAAKKYDVNGNVQFDPWLIVPLLEGISIGNIVKDHQFFGDVNVEVGVTGAYGDQPDLKVSGAVDAGPSARLGAKVDRAYCTFEYQDSLLALPKMRAEKNGAVSTGSLIINFRSSMLDMELEGGVDPNVVATMIHPVVANVVRLFDFQGANDLKCSGTVDYGTWMKSDMHGTYSGGPIRTPVADVDSAQFDFGMIGNELFFTNIAAQAYGGSGSGSCQFTLATEKNLYSGDLEVVGVDVAPLRNFFTESDTTTNLGKLTGQATLSGELGKPLASNIKSTGSASITDGRLVELPVLKSLTKTARLVFAQFNTFSQTDCSMDFAVSEGAVYTENFVLAGDLMTLNGVGIFDFGTGFDARVEMKPFRKNKMTRLVQWASTPITELLKFDLTGTASDPKWSLSRFPSFKKKTSSAAPGE